jgi:hypothetical protein
VPPVVAVPPVGFPVRGGSAPSDVPSVPAVKVPVLAAPAVVPSRNLVAGDGISICIDLDVVVGLRVGISVLGPPVCPRSLPSAPEEPAPEEPAPEEPAPAPTPASTPTATVSPPRPSVSPSSRPTREPEPVPAPAFPSVRPPAPPGLRPPLAAPRSPRPIESPAPTPSVIPPTPRPAWVHPRAKRLVGARPKRRNPLGTRVGGIVLSTVIAGIASIAFAVR